MKSIAVFCGSSLGADNTYTLAAESLGALLAVQKISLIYGGGNIGLMGKLASAALVAGGHVTGVIPSFMMGKEIGKIDLPDLRVVGSMHERKALMAELADGFIAMPGGFGTLEELAEILTWSQLGLHTKPFGLLNVGGFYDHLIAFFDNATARQLIKPKHRALILTATEPAELLDLMRRLEAHAHDPMDYAGAHLMTPFERQLREAIRVECIAAGNPTHVTVVRFGNPRDDDETYDVTMFVSPKNVTGKIADLVARLSALFAQAPFHMDKRLDTEQRVGWTVTPRID